MRRMRKEEIPVFVQEIIETGCHICAVGYDRYCIGDADLSVAEYIVASPELERIGRAYGEREHLVSEIAAHLRMLGRYIEVDPPTIH